MRCTVLLFAQARDIVGRDRLSLELRAGSTAGDALAEVLTQHPSMSTISDRLALAVDERYANRDTPLRDGCVIALIPPVSGG